MFCHCSGELSGETASEKGVLARVRVYVDVCKYKHHGHVCAYNASGIYDKIEEIIVNKFYVARKSSDFREKCASSTGITLETVGWSDTKNHSLFGIYFGRGSIRTKWSIY